MSERQFLTDHQFDAMTHDDHVSLLLTERERRRWIQRGSNARAYQTSLIKAYVGQLKAAGIWTDVKAAVTAAEA